MGSDDHHLGAEAVTALSRAILFVERFVEYVSDAPFTYRWRSCNRSPSHGMKDFVTALYTPQSNSLVKRAHATSSVRRQSRRHIVTKHHGPQCAGDGGTNNASSRLFLESGGECSRNVLNAAGTTQRCDSVVCTYLTAVHAL